MPGRAHAWLLGYREARVHALIAAAVLWTTATVATLGSPGSRYLTGHLKGADFVQVYTLTHLAFERQYPSLDDAERFHERQVELVPESAPERYLPVYPPTVALFIAPLRLLPFDWAVIVWTVVVLGGYAAIVRATRQDVRDAVPDGLFVAAAAAAFPPFWLLVLYGQTTLIPLLGFFLAWYALKAESPFGAGMALGLLSVKPQFGLVIACVFVLNGEWRVLLGIVLSVALQLLAVSATMGSQALIAYSHTVAGIASVEGLLEPDSWRMHSLRTLTNLVPGAAGSVVWGLLCAGLVAMTVRVWRAPAPLAARLGVVVLASVLANPHLFVYDATVLVLPLLWLGGWIQREQPELRTRYWHWVYFLFVLLLIPTAQLIYIQGSVLLMCWMFWRLSWSICHAGTRHPMSQVGTTTDGMYGDPAAPRA